MKTILIFAYECVPFNRPGSTIGAQRPFQFAKYLPELGWRCIVLCCDFNQRRTIGKDDLNELTLKIRDEIFNHQNNKTIIIPLPSLKYADLVDKIWWKFTGTDPESGNHYPKGGLFGAIIRKIFTGFKLFRGDHSQNWQESAKVATDEIMKITSIDACLGEVGPDAGLFLAKWWYNKYKLPWVVDFRDPILKNHKSGIKNILRLFYRRKLKKALFTINVNPVWTKGDELDFKTRSICITNGFDEAELKELNGQEINEENDKLVISYGGNVNTGKIHSLSSITTFLSGVKLALREKPELIGKHFKFIYFGSHHLLVYSLISNLELNAVAISQPQVSRYEALIKYKKSDILLLLTPTMEEINDPYFKNGFYPGKVFEYMGINKPILSVPGDNGILDELILNTNSGNIIGDPDKIKEYIINNTSDKKDKLTSSFLPKKEIINNYSRKTQTKILVDYLNDQL